MKKLPLKANIDGKNLGIPKNLYNIKKQYKNIPLKQMEDKI